MSDELTRQEIVDRCIERLLDGESLDDVLASYAGRGAELLPLLKAAGALVAAPSPQPSPAARSLAMSRMLAQAATEAQQPKPEGVFGWLGTLRARPLAFQAVAVLGAVVLFAGLGIGASAATGTTPAPVRTLFRLPDNSPKNVRLSGVVLSASDSAVVIDTAGGQRTIVLGSSTVLRRGNGRIAWSDLHAGETIDVNATERDGQVVAKQVSAEAEESEPTAAQPAGEGTRGPEEDRDTETPRGDRTPEERGGDSLTPGPSEQPDASATPGGRDDDRRSSTPETTQSPQVEGSPTPEPTKSPEQEHDGTPAPTQTSSPDSGGGDH